VVAAGSGALAVTTPPPPLEAKFEADFTPTALSGREQTPLSLRVGMGFTSTDGSPPALEEFEFDEDRHMRLNLGGVPVCNPRLQGGVPLQVMCRSALVGHGTATATFHFPETTTGPVFAPLRVYNGPVAGGAGTLFLVFSLPVPTAAVYISKVSIEKIDDGPYGLKLVGKFPKIAGGFGSVTRLGLRFRKGVFSAVCRNRRLATGFKAGFVDGTELTGAAIRLCTAGRRRPG
jgi:hypothetical protein